MNSVLFLIIINYQLLVSNIFINKMLFFNYYNKN